MENDKDVNEYKEWVHKQTIKVAPGFNYGIMQPHKTELLVSEGNLLDAESNEQLDDVDKDDNGDDDVNELDKVFGKTAI